MTSWVMQGSFTVRVWEIPLKMVFLNVVDLLPEKCTYLQNSVFTSVLHVQYMYSGTWHSIDRNPVQSMECQITEMKAPHSILDFLFLTRQPHKVFFCFSLWVRPERRWWLWAGKRREGCQKPELAQVQTSGTSQHIKNSMMTVSKTLNKELCWLS